MKKDLKTTMANKAHEEIPGNPSVSTSSKQKLNDRSNGKPLRILSEEDWKFWMHNGYVVIKNAIPKAQAKATADFIWEFDEKEANDPSTWYAQPRAEMKMKELAGTGMVEAYNHQTLWNNRQTQKIYDAFVDVWGTEKLWVTIDRVNLNFPQRPGEEKEGFIHWDYDPETRPQNVQGVIALADQMDEMMGGFQCIPWLYRNYDSWKLTQPEDKDRFQPNLAALHDKIVKVVMEAGDLLIFNSTEPHGIRPNRSENKVRIAQYISMMPAEEENQELIDWRVNSWKNRITPEGYAFPGDPRNWEQERYTRADLSTLGKKLLGLNKW
ncbi:MAG: phytanoyl-CoA dioxygenase family protein [Flavobacteriaceae bacterium]|nr:phytanoyl-CoA dioxygenase family protein [Flavobacteriaceae bacterium]MDG1091325.1 phytanoyl-CoA dioxygenase family protein [Flavobacteriaceae bacterium]